MRLSIPLAALVGAGVLFAGSMDSPVNTNTTLVDRKQGIAANPYLGNGKWSGYVATYQGTQLFKSVSASWIEPAFQCRTKRDLGGVWVGLGGTGLGDEDWLMQIGTITDCDPRNIKHYPFWETVDSSLPEKDQQPPQRIDLSIKPGDHLIARVSTDNNGNWKFDLENKGKWVYGKEFPHVGFGISAEAVVESPNWTYPGFTQIDLDDFAIDDKPATDSGIKPYDSTNKARTKFTTSTGPIHGDPGGPIRFTVIPN